MTVADRTKSINLELLEEMFQIEEKEKTLNAGKLNVQETGISEHINSNSMFEMNREIKFQYYGICYSIYGRNA